MRPFGWRDRILVTICNRIMRLSSKEYRTMVGVAVIYGLDELEKNYRTVEKVVRHEPK